MRIDWLLTYWPPECFQELRPPPYSNPHPRLGYMLHLRAIHTMSVRNIKTTTQTPVRNQSMTQSQQDTNQHKNVD